MKIAFKSLIIYTKKIGICKAKSGKIPFFWNFGKIIFGRFSNIVNCDFICFGIFLSILAKFDWICKKFHRQVTTIQFDDN